MKGNEKFKGVTGMRTVSDFDTTGLVGDLTDHAPGDGAIVERYFTHRVPNRFRVTWFSATGPGGPERHIHCAGQFGMGSTPPAFGLLRGQDGAIALRLYRLGGMLVAIAPGGRASYMVRRNDLRAGFQIERAAFAMWENHQ
jgi:hypothetical protein